MVPAASTPSMLEVDKDGKAANNSEGEFSEGKTASGCSKGVVVLFTDSADRHSRTTRSSLNLKKHNQGNDISQHKRLAHQSIMQDHWKISALARQHSHTLHTRTV